MLFCCLLIFFRNAFEVSNSLDPDQARHFVGPDLGPNFLQRLSADDIRRQRVDIVRSLSVQMFTVNTKFQSILA